MVQDFTVTASQEYVAEWLESTADEGCVANTLLAYSYGLNDYLTFCQTKKLNPFTVRRKHIASYVNDLSTRSVYRKAGVEEGLALATKKHRVTIVRLYYDFLVEERVRKTNPVRRGNFVRRGRHNATRGLISGSDQERWIPSDLEFNLIIDHMEHHETLRNQVMFSLGYETMMRREELCLLHVTDLDLNTCSVTIRKETTKSRRSRRIPFSKATADLLARYIAIRQPINSHVKALFLSESRQNEGDGIGRGTWSKVIESVAQKTGLSKFTPHTLRHLGITHLLRKGYGLLEVSKLAGHQDVRTTGVYVHISKEQIISKMAQIVASATRTSAA